MKLGELSNEPHEVDMEMTPQSSHGGSAWSSEAKAMIAHAKVLSGEKLEQLVLRLQRH